MLTAERIEFLTVDEAAARTGVSTSTIRKAIKSGQLAYRRRRGQWKLLAAAEVDAWAKRREEI